MPNCIKCGKSQAKMNKGSYVSYVLTIKLTRQYVQMVLIQIMRIIKSIT